MKVKRASISVSTGFYSFPKSSFTSCAETPTSLANSSIRCALTLHRSEWGSTFFFNSFSNSFSNWVLFTGMLVNRSAFYKDASVLPCQMVQVFIFGDFDSTRTYTFNQRLQLHQRRAEFTLASKCILLRSKVGFGAKMQSSKSGVAFCRCIARPAAGLVARLVGWPAGHSASNRLLSQSHPNSDSVHHWIRYLLHWLVVLTFVICCVCIGWQCSSSVVSDTWHPLSTVAPYLLSIK